MEIPSPNPENGANTKIDRAVFVMYPDEYSTGKYGVDEDGQMYSFAANLYRGLSTRLIDYYKNHGWKVYSILYADSTPESFTPLYPYESFDGHLQIPTVKDKWREERHYQNLEAVVSGIQFADGARVRVGGFHMEACVADMIRFLRKKGVDAKVSLPLTEQALGFLTIARYKRRTLSSLDSEDRKLDVALYRMFEDKIETAIERED